jgi:hypothetical protein
MAALTVRLVAIIAPGSVEAGVGKVQAAIFEEHGFLSAVALPPMIPVTFLPQDTAAAKLLNELERGVRAPWRMRTAGFTWEHGALYARVSSDGFWESLRMKAAELAPAETSPLFPVAEGFYAGCLEAAPDQRPLIRPAVPELSFSSATLAIIRISSPRGREGWWREVMWEIQEQRPLRGRRDT